MRTKHWKNLTTGTNPRVHFQVGGQKPQTFFTVTFRGCYIYWFSVHYAAAARREYFGINALRGKRHQLGSPNLQDIFIGGKLLWD